MGHQGALNATKLLRPFSEIVDSLELKEPFIRNWIDPLSFLLAGVKSNGILSAAMVYMSAEWYKPGYSLEYPNHGTGAVVNALVCGLQKFGGRISFKSHVENIVVENGRAMGDISEDSKIHHIVVNDWERGVDADQNVVLISIPSVLSPDLVPPGKHVLHAYMPGTEPFGLWEGLDRKSAKYKELKAKRSEVLWRAVERAVGLGFDREKCEVKLVGTPLTHRIAISVYFYWAVAHPIWEYHFQDVDWILEFLGVLLEKHLINAVSNRNSSNASRLSLSGNEVRKCLCVYVLMWSELQLSMH
ncbi:hypothetical protein HYC85_009882 [Camellia sinensis]|uniref:Amine oxidase domain-containing protein n=1 Tax=Camellia sinensis TaxID=4442 RepID=A0A7J7HIX5_CAMSI|nr:hypothetical protein HYC85_009882 [Camellia sinensis]